MLWDKEVTKENIEEFCKFIKGKEIKTPLSNYTIEDYKITSTFYKINLIFTINSKKKHAVINWDIISFDYLNKHGSFIEKEQPLPTSNISKIKDCTCGVMSNSILFSDLHTNQCPQYYRPKKDVAK